MIHLPWEGSFLIGALEGFGLSEYEAKAYVTLLSKGPMLVSELAYHSTIPRTKAYTTLRKLETKKLVILSSGNPVRCHPVPPEECLERILSGEEQRLRAMRKAVARLRRIREESARPLIVEEVRHFILGPSGILAKIPELASSARNSISILADGWGARLMEQTKDHFSSAPTVEARALLNLEEFPHQAGSWGIKIRLKSIPRGRSLFLFDGEALLLCNSDNGGGILINSPNLCDLVQDFFDEYWEDSLPLEFIMNSENRRVSRVAIKRALMMAKDTFIKATIQTLDEGGRLKIGEAFLRTLTNDSGLDISSMDIEDAVILMTSLQEITYPALGKIAYNPQSKVLTFDLKDSPGKLPSSVWALALARTLAKERIDLKSSEGGGSLHAKVLQEKFPDV